MRPERVVEILKDSQSAGSGYLIAPRHVLTARHVLKPLTKGTLCKIRPLSRADDEALPLGPRRRPQALNAHVDWSSKNRDLAVVEIDRPEGVRGIASGTIEFGVLHDDGIAYPFLGSGFPEASGEAERRIDGTLQWVRTDRRFDVNIENGPPRDWQEWGGFSGSAIFSNGVLVAVIRRVDKNWDGRVLQATPVEWLLENKSFESYWRGVGLTPPKRVVVSRGVVEPKEGSITISVPKGASFSGVASLVGRQVSKNVLLENFDPAELSASLKQQSLECRNAVALLKELGGLAIDVR